MEGSDRLHALVSRILAALVTLMVTQPSLPAQSLGDSQAAALEWTPPSVEAAALHAERLAAELTPWGQVDYSARLGPLLRYQDYPDDDDSGELTARLRVSAQIDFMDRPATHARALQALERARQRTRLMRLEGVRNALLAHAELLIAQEQELAAFRALQEAEAELGAATAGSRLPLELRSARLDQRMAALDYREVQENLLHTREEAAAFDLAPQARYRPLRFVLPEAPPAEDDYRRSHAYRMLELELLEAEAELAEVQRGPLDDLRVRAAYRLPGAQVDVEGGLINGQPGATLGVGVPGGSDRWELEVSAQLVLDDAYREVPALESAVEVARAKMHGFAAIHQRDRERAVNLAALAEEAVSLAEEEAALAEELLLGDLGAARIRLYRAWISYIRATATALELAGATWEVRAR